MSSSPNRYTKKKIFSFSVRSTYCKSKSTLSSLEEKPWGLAPTRRAETSTEKRREEMKRQEKKRTEEKTKKEDVTQEDNTFNPMYEVLPP